MFFKEKSYERNYLNKVVHTTFNPYEPGVVRIHLVPSKFSWFRPITSVAIINGQYLIPIGPSWSILLSVFINNVNNYNGREITEENLEEVVKTTIDILKDIYGKHIKDKMIREDLVNIINTFREIAEGKEPNDKIPVISIGKYAKYMKAPHRMDLMISSMKKDNNWHCNQKCLHCYAAGGKCANVNEISTDDWKKIIDKCKEIGIPQLTFTGGEPTLREDLVELVNYAKWFVTRLNTNGILLNKKLCSMLYKASLDSVQITLYSHDEDIHNKLVGSNHFKDTVTGIKNAVNAGLCVSVNTPLCILNKDYVETLKFLNSLGIKYVTCSGIIPAGSGNSKEAEDLKLDNAQMLEILKEAVKYCHENLMEINFTSPGWIKDKDLKNLKLTIPMCGACLSNMAIAPNGDVIPCQSWLDDNASLGNILDTDWEKIWNSKKCKKIREISSKMKGICQLKRK